MDRRLGFAAIVVALALVTPSAFAAARAARTLYDTKCALCHGRDGKSNPALAAAKVRNFTDADWQRSRTDGQIHASIADGKDGTLMRAFKNDLSAEEIAGLVKFIRAFVPPAPKEDATK